jgi:rhodanese-related sulfurtransferase
MMTTTAAELVSNAKARVENLTPEQVLEERRRGAILVDLRELGELDSEGMIEGAVHAPRGMLEFWADPSTPYHRPEFHPDRRTILYCASGGRSALAAVALSQLGYSKVAHLDGGLSGWKQASCPVVSGPSGG